MDRFQLPILDNFQLAFTEICGQYKSREEVEQVFDTMKSDIESDKTYLRDSEKVKGVLLHCLSRVEDKIQNTEGAEGSQLTWKDVCKRDNI